MNKIIHIKTKKELNNIKEVNLIEFKNLKIKQNKEEEIN